MLILRFKINILIYFSYRARDRLQRQHLEYESPLPQLKSLRKDLFAGLKVTDSIISFFFKKKLIY
jgi:hypothetical protein